MNNEKEGLSTEKVELKKYKFSYFKKIRKDRWLKGDDNTKFFHACIKSKKKTNQISTLLVDENG